MKISLSWVFDHINGSYNQLDIEDIVHRFNTTTAEIEQVTKVRLSLADVTFIRIQSFNDTSAQGISIEHNQQIVVPVRDDLHTGQLYLIKKENHTWRWATSNDLHGFQQTLLPPFYLTEDELSGTWKNKVEVEDYILEVDNKSINHRPDLWGHRGIAREIAALFDLELVPQKNLLANCQIKEYEQFCAATPNNLFSFEIRTDACKRFAGLYISSIEIPACWWWMAWRLIRVDSRPINGIVDLTNYILFDLGQPLHAFDVDKLSQKKLIARQAVANEQMTLLDGTIVTLADQDIVISDDTRAQALAGVMGGAYASVSNETRSVIIEAASFDATVVRRTAHRVKKRTDASTRFEKSIDPQGNTAALLRFIKLLTNEHVLAEIAPEISSLGPISKPHILTISHAFIQQRLGTLISPDKISDILSKLDFEVTVSSDQKRCFFEVIVPSYRSTKDVTIPEDIVEEVGRFYGYDKIKLVLPTVAVTPSDNHTIKMVYLIKQFMATAGGSHEVQNYAVFDQSFIEAIGWHLTNPVRIKNPVSQNWQYMVTSLIPHLLKNVKTNHEQSPTLSFFEINKVWDMPRHAVVQEQLQFSGVIYGAKLIDFYQQKQTLVNLFKSLGRGVIWQKANDKLPKWYHPYKTAALYCDQAHIGYAGMIHPDRMESVCQGDAFIFEINADQFLSCKSSPNQFVPLGVYPAVERDISMLVPLHITVDQLICALREADTRIFDVSLIDFFEKKEWATQRAVTVRILARDAHKTLNEDEIGSLYKSMINALKPFKVVIR